MLEIDEQNYSFKLLNILIDIEDEDDIKSRRELQKLIVSYYERFGTKEELLKAYQEFYNIILTIEDTDLEDDSSGLTATMELYQTKEEQVSLKRENEQLERSMNTDDLTNVSNRRRFNEDIADVRLQKKKSIAVAMLDVDYFKEYNDIYGHLMGDQVLIDIGKCMNTYQKEGAVQFYRYGGDEFSIIFINQSDKAISNIMDSLSADIKRKKIPHKGSKTNQFLTLSYGYAISRQKNINVRQLLKQADEKLYDVKKLRVNQYMK